MNVGNKVYTPRFCTVTIQKVFENESDARKDGYTEPTYWDDPEFGILGRSEGINQMTFVAYKKRP